MLLGNSHHQTRCYTSTFPDASTYSEDDLNCDCTEINSIIFLLHLSCLLSKTYDVFKRFYIVNVISSFVHANDVVFIQLMHFKVPWYNYILVVIVMKC